MTCTLALLTEPSSPRRSRSPSKPASPRSLQKRKSRTYRSLAGPHGARPSFACSGVKMTDSPTRATRNWPIRFRNQCWRGPSAKRGVGVAGGEMGSEIDDGLGPSWLKTMRPRVVQVRETALADTGPGGASSPAAAASMAPSHKSAVARSWTRSMPRWVGSWCKGATSRQTRPVPCLWHPTGAAGCPRRRPRGWPRPVC